MAEARGSNRGEAWQRFAVAMSLGGIGGATFAYLQLPLPWMLGAMLFSTAGALGGLRLAVPLWLRQMLITVLGVMLGSAFTPELLDQIAGWSSGFALLLGYIPITTALCFLYFRKVAKFDPVTAYFSAAPGGFNEMVLAGEAMGGNVRSIALVHSMRILLVVFTIPVYFRYLAPHAAPPVSAAARGLGLDISPRDAGVLLACAVLGWPLARMIRLPAAQLVGPMLISAAAHLTGLTASKPPIILVALAQVVLGAAIGARFSGLKLGAVAHVMRVAIWSVPIMLGVTACFTWLATHFVSMSPDAVTLSLSPGGLTEMSLVALSLGIETAFVSAMHIARIGLVVTLAPLAFRLMRGR